MRPLTRRRLLALSSLTMLAACGPKAGQPQPTRWGDGLTPIYARPDRDEWPAEFAQVAPETQGLYRYAVANHETLRYIPCFCGCVNGGHRSNFDCYVRDVLPDGRVRLDTMSFG